MKAVERVKQYIDFKGFNNSTFEKQNSLSNGYIATQLKRNADLGEGILTRILTNCVDINTEWLLTGNGTMLKESCYPDNDGSDTFEEQSEIYKKIVSRKDEIPLIPIEDMAGFNADEAKIKAIGNERFIVPVFKDADFLIQVNGTSMYPKYNSGDIVACKKLSLDDVFFQWNKVYVLDTDQGALLKKVDMASDDDHVMIVSEDENYKPFLLHKSKISAIAIVLGVIRLE